jgi:hypothetical protein
LKSTLDPHAKLSKNYSPDFTLRASNGSFRPSAQKSHYGTGGSRMGQAVASPASASVVSEALRQPFADRHIREASA